MLPLSLSFSLPIAHHNTNPNRKRCTWNRFLLITVFFFELNVKFIQIKKLLVYIKCILFWNIEHLSYKPMFLLANQNLNPSSYLLSPILWIVVNLSLMFLSSKCISLCTDEEGLSPWRLAFLSRQMVYRTAWNTYWRVNFGTFYWDKGLKRLNQCHLIQIVAQGTINKAKISWSLILQTHNKQN